MTGRVFAERGIKRIMFRNLAAAAIVSIAMLFTGSIHGSAADNQAGAKMVLDTWYRLMLELVRHTPTYTPPVASRAMGYVGVTAYEAIASGSARMESLGGQLNGLAVPPSRQKSVVYDEAVVLEAALAKVVRALFSNTGPTGQRAMGAMSAKLGKTVTAGVTADIVERSTAYGTELADHILRWAAADGGATIINMGFPVSYSLKPGPAAWRPTSLIVQQQAPLLPGWGEIRPFAMPAGAICALPPPPAYSEDPGSEFHRQAREVHETSRTLTDEQRTIARFWADDAMLSTTPPGHWISIALQIIRRDNLSLERGTDVLARLGIAVADAFIGCWHDKFRYDLLRPVTYIRRLIDPKWESLLITPPFPEYPSGHSTQSGAAAAVLTAVLGEGFAFEDATLVPEGMPARRFASFWQAAEEAGLSRLYGGIHFRAAIVQGLAQGRCIGAYAAALRTLR